MKNQIRILAVFIIAISIMGCSNGTKNSNQEQELTKESKLFNDLLSLTQNLNQFEGTAFVGSLDGPCYMVLTSNSQGDNIAKLRYQINNYYQGKADKVDETYAITELKRKSAKRHGFGLKNTRDYEDTYLYGNINGLKASINDGEITDGSGSGNIWFLLDSVDYELTYIITSSANWSFQGSIGLEIEQYIKLKELFTIKKLSENEEQRAEAAAKLEKELDKASEGFDKTDSGLRYLITEANESGQEVKAGDLISVHYSGQFLDGKVFDSSLDRGEPIEFNVGTGRVIPGWDEGLQLLKVGEKATFIIPSELAYGENGRGPIPPNTPLKFEVKIMDVVEE